MPPKKASKKRECVITGNWKMHKTIREAKRFVETLTPLIGESQAKVCLGVPYTAIYPTAELCKKLKSSLHIGGQNMHEAVEGAFTGEISALMLVDAGAEFVLLGHSERRRLFHEDSHLINKKIKCALLEGLQPLLCVGENEEERLRGQMKSILEKQLLECMAGLSCNDLSKMILAYEPVWAIGTGKTATPIDAQEAHLFCRQVITNQWDKESSEALVIQYGGSVNENNAAKLLEMSDIDGLLVGGASLSPVSFSKIVNSVKL